MKVVTIAEFAQEKGFVSVAQVVRENTNGYPYITFIDADNKAENVYFSKEAAKNVTAGQAVDADMMKTYQIAFTTNEAGEERVKLIGNSGRLDLSALLGFAKQQDAVAAAAVTSAIEE